MSWLNRALKEAETDIGKENEILSMDTSEGVLPVVLRHSARARRITLRISQKTGGAVLVIPPGCDLEKAFKFARSHAGWIRRQLARQEPAIPFAGGELLPLRGVEHMILHKNQLRGAIKPVAALDGGHPKLEVPAPPEHLARRLGDWLRAQARRDLERAVETHAATLNVTIGRISVRDQKSRWGSCSSRGNLNFNWRLVLAPRPVMDYVAAHEVAHLIEMNHSEKFWRLVKKAMPSMQQPRSWLKQNGARLHRYG